MFLFEFDNDGGNKFATISHIEEITREMMKYLKPGLPFPHIKVVNNVGSKWLGRDEWKPANPNNTTMLFQKSITGNDKTLRRIVAHELCHHEDFLLNYVPLSNAQKRMHNKLKTFSHGKTWQEIADRFNKVFGKDFVTKTSDESDVITDTGSSYYLLVLRVGKVFRSAMAVRPTQAQIKFIHSKLSSSKEGDGEVRLFKTSDPILAYVEKIGKGWSMTFGGTVLEKLINIWDNGTQVKPPELKPEETPEEAAVSKGVFVVLQPFTNSDKLTCQVYQNPTPKEKDRMGIWTNAKVFKVNDPGLLKIKDMGSHMSPDYIGPEYPAKLRRLWETGKPVPVTGDNSRTYGKQLDFKNAPMNSLN